MQAEGGVIRDVVVVHQLIREIGVERRVELDVEKARFARLGPAHAKDQLVRRDRGVAEAVRPGFVREQGRQRHRDRQECDGTQRVPSKRL